MTALSLRAGRRSIEISSPDKVLFPEDGVTKADLASYYGEVAPTMLPYARDRPAHMHRYPDGLDGEDWVQKQVSRLLPRLDRDRDGEEGGGLGRARGLRRRRD